MYTEISLHAQYNAQTFSTFCAMMYKVKTQNADCSEREKNNGSTNVGLRSSVFLNKCGLSKVYQMCNCLLFDKNKGRKLTHGDWKSQSQLAYAYQSTQVFLAAIFYVQIVIYSVVVGIK